MRGKAAVAEQLVPPFRETRQRSSVAWERRVPAAPAETDDGDGEYRRLRRSAGPDMDERPSGSVVDGTISKCFDEF